MGCGSGSVEVMRAAHADSYKVTAAQGDRAPATRGNTQTEPRN